MSQALLPGWAEELGRRASSPDEATRAEALGVQPRRCFRVSDADTLASRRRGQRKGTRSRHGLKSLPPLEEDEL
jgi:hypothetical protein